MQMTKPRFGKRDILQGVARPRFGKRSAELAVVKRRPGFPLFNVAVEEPTKRGMGISYAMPRSLIALDKEGIEKRGMELGNLARPRFGKRSVNVAEMWKRGYQEMIRPRFGKRSALENMIRPRFGKRSGLENMIRPRFGKRSAIENMIRPRFGKRASDIADMMMHQSEDMSLELPLEIWENYQGEDLDDSLWMILPIHENQSEYNLIPSQLEDESDLKGISYNGRRLY
ncbi:uncharacterized protein LOC111709604 [Eurytemora carolleeae]|uniref:uncharacterized protein LOC111709604 n=1 Tax=Eurytemora carolleeae TaxID=1294199 RepID=UPI000C77CE9A|nr:uncharacterized protein LOC111709604 [Eurytemora carolleeae]|eukprot:XP_023339109.1 uncharacterized protein LOC111709604 [Eurytemora affinis]